MFLHIDESGNTGNNLFDRNQPILSYGVLSSRWNVDAHAEKQHKAILNVIGADSLHANQLGAAGLEKISQHLVDLHRQYCFGFDYYFIDKPSFAVVTFFNAVFDAGLNPAMKWDWYWTPLRFPLLFALAAILDDNLLRESWRLCSLPQRNLGCESASISKLLGAALSRLEASPVSDRFKEILGDALKYGIKNPLELDFGIYSPTALSPNTIGFQFVLTAIAYRQKIHRNKALGITVDRQTQFNGAQVRTYEIQDKISAVLRGNGSDRDKLLTHPFLADVREDTETLIEHFPQEPLVVEESAGSFGLQITDTYLWLVNRCARGKGVPRAIAPIVESISKTGMIDGISMAAMMERWTAFEQKLPAFDELSEEQLAAVQETVNTHRSRVKTMKLG